MCKHVRCATICGTSVAGRRAAGSRLGLARKVRRHERVERDDVRGQGHHPARRQTGGPAAVRARRGAGCLGAADRLRRLVDRATSSATSSTRPRATSPPSTRPGAAARRRRRTGCRRCTSGSTRWRSAFRRVPQAEMMAAAARRLRQDDGHPGAARPRRVDRPDGHPRLHGPGAGVLLRGRPADGLRRPLLGHPAGHRSRARPAGRRRRPAGAVHVRDLAGHRPHRRGRGAGSRSGSGSAGATPATSGSRSARRGSRTSRATSRTCRRGSSSTPAAWCSPRSAGATSAPYGATSPWPSAT